MRRVEIDPAHPSPELLARGGKILQRGGLVAFPTETVYGLGGNALDAEATRQRAHIEGDVRLAAPLLAARSVMV